MRKIFLLFIVFFMALLSYSQNASLNSTTDSGDVYFSKFVLSDSIHLKIKFLNQAARLHPRDSFWYYIASEYLALDDMYELSKYSLKALKTKIQTGKYRQQEFDNYTISLWAMGRIRGLRSFYKGIKGNKILIGNRLLGLASVNKAFEIDDLNNNISRLKDSINVLKTQKKRDNFFYATIAWDYFMIGRNLKARQYLNRGSKTSSNLWPLYYMRGKMNILRGKYDVGLKYLTNSLSLSLGEPIVMDWLERAKRITGVHHQLQDD